MYRGEVLCNERFQVQPYVGLVKHTGLSPLLDVWMRCSSGVQGTISFCLRFTCICKMIVDN